MPRNHSKPHPLQCAGGFEEKGTRSEKQKNELRDLTECVWGKKNDEKGGKDQGERDTVDCARVQKACGSVLSPMGSCAKQK